jgi:hypothetical protein
MGSCSGSSPAEFVVAAAFEVLPEIMFVEMALADTTSEK